jgi:hypothetical protein
MVIERDSVHFHILERLCGMPKPVRGISGAMLERHFGAPAAVEELASLGLIQARGWANGPGMIWIPTAAGEDLYHDLAEGGGGRPPVQPVKTRLESTATEAATPEPH